MVLKANWEKTNEVITLDDKTIRTMISNALPEKKLSSYKIISGGCANLNIKLTFRQKADSLILRVYLRDKKAALKEQKLSALICKTIPVPETIYVGNAGEYRYAITKFIDGITLRDVLLGKERNNLSNVLFQVGQILSRMQDFKFEECGDFDKKLNVVPFPADYCYLPFARKCLNNKWVKNVFDQNELNRVLKIIVDNANHFPSDTNVTLTHGDYDPANILVHKVSGKWKITAILDWEFAHSGSFLRDVANMLRYAHQLPGFYESEFLRGLIDGGVTLPDNWRTQAHLLNLLALLDCLARYDPNTRPKRLKDIKELILYILECLEVETK